VRCAHLLQSELIGSHPKCCAAHEVGCEQQLQPRVAFEMTVQKDAETLGGCPILLLQIHQKIEALEFECRQALGKKNCKYRRQLRSEINELRSCFTEREIAQLRELLGSADMEVQTALKDAEQAQTQNESAVIEVTCPLMLPHC